MMRKSVARLRRLCYSRGMKKNLGTLQPNEERQLDEQKARVDSREENRRRCFCNPISVIVWLSIPLVILFIWLMQLLTSME